MPVEPCEHDWAEVGGEGAPVRLEVCTGCDAHRVWTKKADAIAWLAGARTAIRGLRTLFELCGDPGIEVFAHQIMIVQAAILSGLYPSFSDEELVAVRHALELSEEQFVELVAGVTGPKGEPC